MSDASTRSPIYRERLCEAQRGPHASKLFGIRFPLMVEPFTFDSAASLSDDYEGGYWEFYALCSGGFYMAPTSRESYKVVCANGYEGDMTADAFGITSCLYAYSLLSFAADEELAAECARQYHLLREYADRHAECGGIYRAID